MSIFQRKTQLFELQDKIIVIVDNLCIKPTFIHPTILKNYVITGDWQLNYPQLGVVINVIVVVVDSAKIFIYNVVEQARRLRSLAVRKVRAPQSKGAG